jgi:glycosyltransferase involved in cell wall biosynthesis
MKVCFIASQGNMYSGGQGVYLHYLSRELTQLGHEVHVIAGLPYPTVAPGVRLHKLKTFSFWNLMDGYREYAYRTHPLLYFHPLNFYEFASTRLTLTSLLNMFSLRAYQKLNELERAGPFDVVHDNQTLGYGIWLMKARGKPVVANIHHPLAIDRQNELRQARSMGKLVSRIVWYPWLMQTWVAMRVDRVITGSESSAESITEALHIPREHIRVIYDGVDGDVYCPQAEAERPNGSVLFVGHTEDKNKGFRYLLEALRLLDARLSYHLTVVQRPNSREAERLVRELALKGTFTFLERLSTEELVRQYNRAQLLVSPSLYEGFGLPAAEAQACGTPVVATTAGALREIVEDGVTGRLVPAADAGALAEAIAALLADPAACRAMGDAGARRVRERFSWRRTAEETLALYEEVRRRPEARAQHPLRMS